ncbi:helix-turn-helix transcriptional regulator [Desulforhopalus singaporensis]|uniref:Predicted transcriptional regulator YheO, contains PAS and DNA-binding HTH domains n=1 Tax=Desulforhopalus singaporensis TaxID=91360 RepID=A0A1H0QYS0_9BACT|nr:PAS domain-containing protein [Desulforhopalus singaporensis]SDP21916.1 Predicted transcriptional regulator YheO, contains PAS and DNA-binding HTH domains [Desulforhopalus singaporensis]
MTECESIIENLKHLADGVVAQFGKNCEACVHDLTSLPDSLVYIQGDVTRKTTGAPTKELLRQLANQKVSSPINTCNYKTTTEDGRNLKSTTTLIRDSSGVPVAAFCINFDTTDFYTASQVLRPFLTQESPHPGQAAETLPRSFNQSIEALFSRAVNEVGRHPTAMTVEDRTRLIALLEKNGTFRLKGAVEKTARLMGVTKYTVYNYLKKNKK